MIEFLFLDSQIWERSQVWERFRHKIQTGFMFWLNSFSAAWISMGGKVTKKLSCWFGSTLPVLFAVSFLGWAREEEEEEQSSNKKKVAMSVLDFSRSRLPSSWNKARKKKKRAQQEDGLHPPPRAPCQDVNGNFVLSNGETDFTTQSHTQEEEEEEEERRIQNRFLSRFLKDHEWLRAGFWTKKNKSSLFLIVLIWRRGRSFSIFAIFRQEWWSSYDDEVEWSKNGKPKKKEPWSSNFAPRNYLTKTAV